MSVAELARGHGSTKSSVVEEKRNSITLLNNELRKLDEVGLRRFSFVDTIIIIYMKNATW